MIALSICPLIEAHITEAQSDAADHGSFVTSDEVLSSSQSMINELGIEQFCEHHGIQDHEQFQHQFRKIIDAIWPA